MKAEQQAVLSFVKIANRGKVTTLPAFLDFGEIVKIACQQGVSCLVFDGLQVLIEKNGNKNIPQEFVLQLYAKKLQTEKAMLEKKKVICEYVEKLQPYQCVVLKGLDYSQYWPNPLYREYGDLDSWYGADCLVINEKSTKIGAHVEHGTHKHSHIRYKNLTVENHRTLTSYDGSKEGIATEKKLQELLNETAASPLMDTCMLSPNPTFTACFMLKHAQLHFMAEGLELRHFLDWMYFIDSVKGKVDLKRLVRLFDEMKLKNFADMMTSFCIKNFGWNAPIDIEFDSDLLCKVEEFVFSEKADVNNRRPLYIIVRMLKRFARAWHFRKLHYLPYHKAVWTWIAYASSLDRKPSKWFCQ